MSVYIDFIFGKLGSGAFIIYVTISAYFMLHGNASYASLWLRLSEAYITYNAASYFLTGEQSLSLPRHPNWLINFVNWLLNNFFSRKVFVLVLAMIIVKHGQMGIVELFEIGIFMLGGRMVEKFSRGVQKEMKQEKLAATKKVTIRLDEEEGDA